MSEGDHGLFMFFSANKMSNLMVLLVCYFNNVIYNIEIGVGCRVEIKHA